MNIQDDALTPEERALAERLARLGPLREPGAALDARILAAAHAAVQPRAGGARRKAAAWPAALGIAASLLLAVGLAWKLRPQPGPQAAGEAAAPAAKAPAKEAPPAAPAPTARPEDAPETQEVPSGMESLHPPAVASPASVARRRAPAPPAAFKAAPATPAAVVPPPPPESATAGAPALPAPADAAAQATADLATQDSATSEAERAAPARRTREARATTAVQAQEASAEPDEDVVPPTTAASPQVRDAWLLRIRELVRAGRIADARTSLREFRHRYPGFALPDDLRALEE